jgi:hypothetical protein
MNIYIRFNGYIYIGIIKENLNDGGNKSQGSDVISYNFVSSELDSIPEIKEKYSLLNKIRQQLEDQTVHKF